MISGSGGRPLLSEKLASGLKDANRQLAVLSADVGALRSMDRLFAEPEAGKKRGLDLFVAGGEG